MEADKYYHIFNRTNGSELLFKSDENFNYFLRQYTKYINPIAKTYAYCLLPNHFHLVVQIKAEEELNSFFKDKLIKSQKSLESLIIQQFSNLFNSYTQAFNKMHARSGSLFSPNFKKKNIDSVEYLRQVIVYVHLNPMLHGFNVNFEKYKFSTYQSLLSIGKTNLNRIEVIELFDDLENFKFVHNRKKVKVDLLKSIIDEDI